MRLLLVLFAALLAIGNATHVNFRKMSSTRTANGVKYDTGYDERVLKYIWRIACQGLWQASSSSS